MFKKANITLLAQGEKVTSKMTIPVQNLKARWFFATDLPKKKPYDLNYKPTRSPKRFIPFSKFDSSRIETTYLSSFSKDAKKDDKILSNIPVNEDYLFEVNLYDMEIRPVYWSGPIYEIRRGIWFDTKGNPLSHDLTEELEALYQQLKFNKDGVIENQTKDIYNLEGDYEEGSIAMFLDNKSAFLLNDISGGVFQLKFLRSSFGQNVPTNAIKVTREYSNIVSRKVSDKKLGETNGEITDVNANNSLGKIGEMIGLQLTDIFSGTAPEDNGKIETDSKVKSKENEFLSSEMENDYNNSNSTILENPSNNRNVKHLVLCIHGIGQTLGKQYQYVNFAHTINLLRINMKKVYCQSPDMKQINKDAGNNDWQTNCDVQVLPVDWRHDIDFKTDDIDALTTDSMIPNLTEITLRGITPFRKLLGDVGLDVLLYDDPLYKEQILNNTVSKLNGIYNIFKKQNPEFNGKVHIIGHSLGSVIAFDTLSNLSRYKLDFPVEKLFCIGSPVGVYKLVQKTNDWRSKKHATSQINFQAPKVNDLYNIYHINDPIAYRMEPLIDRDLATYEEVYLPHLPVEGITNKMLALGNTLIKDLPMSEKANVTSRKKVILPEVLVKKLKEINSNGRVDYVLTPNLLDMDIISALKSHVSYFEDIDIAGFILKETIKTSEQTNEINAIRIIDTARNKGKSFDKLG
ncbi:hypothetical protein TPHA_0D02820 [Tetrapisispora phaffii CBS 4417]|uniref:DDHD domain-containing protein n=1 Tax=Tetrapisispora phaffii (strain ATCC 24235 / CBS 4417 / NBRC 1672 / NRRL Y-8282 / UCD 70-5) TaxID=1071381 RepID=G8BSU7_TETPH|nr:hypothetical protein TPHA_0D02820 [Tetrapisispora phaffii CBS 4417]CCE62918.1 hypothetical protein TPHA_0D02820 [Tetrapisispora phaffii CBS 4417]